MYYSAGYCRHLSIKEQLRSKIYHLQNLQITLEIIFLFDLKSGDLAEPLEIITVNCRMLLEYFQSFCWFTSLLSLSPQTYSSLHTIQNVKSLFSVKNKTLIHLSVTEMN